MTGSVTCVDHSYTRLQRLKEVLRWYTPPDYKDRVHVMKRDGTALQDDGIYDRVRRTLFSIIIFFVCVLGIGEENVANC